MTDPLDALHAPVEPVHPDPAFTEQLRRRLHQAVLHGGTMTDTAEHAHHTDTQPPWPPTLTPYICVADATHALRWYTEVFGAISRGEPTVMPDGSIGHAELALGDAVLMLAEGSAEVPVQPPTPDPTTHSHTLHLQVADVDATIQLAHYHGAAIERQPQDAPYGRIAVLVDPFGHRWMVNTPPATASRSRQGDVVNITVVVPDDERTVRFFRAVLGITFSPGSVAHAWVADGVTPRFGVWNDETGGTEVQLCYQVDDLDAALRRVTANGGHTRPAERKPYGLLAECTDDQGTRFQLWQPAG